MSQTFITDYFETCAVCKGNRKKCKKVEEKDICSLMCELTLKNKDQFSSSQTLSDIGQKIDINTVFSLFDKLTFQEEVHKGNVQNILRLISIKNNDINL